MAVVVPLTLIIALATGVVSIIVAIIFSILVFKEDPGNEKMVEISRYIEQGAKRFLWVQYRILAIFVLVLFLVILLFLPSELTSKTVPILNGDMNWEQAVAYIVGSAASMFAGYLGMMVGVKANTRAAQGCTKSLDKGFDVAFFGGSVMGLAVVGSALIGISTIYWIFQTPAVVLGFSFGASTIALFMKCGGGIYTKTADVGADLVGKAEYQLPEDDVRNPATIADNVGDNVGDIAGMGSDLFDSYVASILAAMLLANILFLGVTDTVRGTFVILPIILSAVGLIASLIGILLIKWMKTKDPGKLLNYGTYIATAIFAALGALFVWILILTTPGIEQAETIIMWKDYGCVVIGLLSGVLIGWTSDYFTRDDKTPTKNIAKSAEEGDAVVILSGFSYGLLSVVPPALGIAVAMIISFFLDGVFGVAMAAVGMLAIVGTVVSNDAYGPIVDNARAIAEQGGLGEEVIRTADYLDSAGNTAKAITKGFAIGAANLAVFALLFSFAEEAEITIIDLLNINVLIGAFIGVVAPVLFSALLILSVQRNAAKMVDEIRDQFKSNPKILEGTEPPNFHRTIEIATKGALKELILPSLLSILLPLLVGALFGIAALGAFLVGAILSGFVFAIFMSNAGGAWDNAKKWIEDGNLGGKGTDVHKAAITGDTVGDPFKDTAGPSINTLLVVMVLTATIFMGLLIVISGQTGWLGFLVG
ncbi:MAG TPA: sodium-translocating pyrophosphatase [candidate division Zixibacteria bacterium]|nr:sodium-translocating pyrophosphatase [candidate division Zixibacteria bacterium]